MSRSRRHGLELADERRAYHEGIRLFNEGLFFEAHDAWEEIWSRVEDRRRERFYRALIQGAVTLELLRRGRAEGVRQVFLSSAELFDGLPPVFMGLDIPEFLAALRHAIQPVIDDVRTKHVRIDPTRLFRVALRYDPFEKSLNGEQADANHTPEMHGGR